jgi:hypothetical protein
MRCHAMPSFSLRGCTAAALFTAASCTRPALHAPLLPDQPAAAAAAALVRHLSSNNLLFPVGNQLLHRSRSRRKARDSRGLSLQYPAPDPNTLPAAMCSSAVAAIFQQLCCWGTATAMTRPSQLAGRLEQAPGHKCAAAGVLVRRAASHVLPICC